MLVALNGEYGAFYDIVKIKRNGSTIRDVPKSVERVSMEESSSTNSIRDNAENVKWNGQNSDKRFSLADTDSQGSKLSAEQQEFFRNSKVVDENGRLLSVYHGTRTPSFTVFKQSGEDSALGAGIYFAENKEYAKGYSFGSEPYQVYLNITNPYVAEFPGGIVQSELIKKGHDGVYNPSNKFWVAFYPEQIKLTSNKNPSADPDIRYSLSSSFAEQVDDVLDGADTNSTHLYVCETPEILRQAGLPDLPVLMTAKHLKSITNKEGKSKGNYHDLGRDLVKRLPELLARPAMIMDSNSRPDSVVVVTTAVDKENRPVIAAIKMDGNGYINDVQISANVMTSSYGKDNFQNFLETALQENRLLYWNKKRSQEIFKIPGLQLPDNLENLNSDIIIRKTSAKVNTSGQNFSGRYSVSAERPARDENYVNNRLKSYTYSDVDKIVENLTINKSGVNRKLRRKIQGGVSLSAKKRADGHLFHRIREPDKNRRRRCPRSLLS